MFRTISLKDDQEKFTSVGRREEDNWSLSELLASSKFASEYFQICRRRGGKEGTLCLRVTTILEWSDSPRGGAIEQEWRRAGSEM